MPQDILEKDFKIDTRGYRLKEVDQFLDIIIGDYEQFLEIINNLEKEKADLLAEIMNLKQELRNSKLSVEVASNNNSMGEVTNVDIMRRLSNLEKMVYNSKNTLDSDEKDN
jgi:DivIVA domain-containing protein